MDLTIIIVNYNVKFFLEQCLYSVKNASGKLKSEIIVIDNNSVDGSCAMIRTKFPDVILIENKINAGFSKANNQALSMANGRYCLLLNPDTVVEESTFSKCIRFMDDHPDAGALGVKMIDGRGNFLPESKRSLPTPAVGFFKIFGLAKLFPRSEIFGKYHLSYLDRDKIHEVQVVSGAFMLLRKKALDKTGLLDEDFFMYGEDIDLSYRLTIAGYKNYYFPETTIIHYKGESTKKGSLNYILVFYKAMIIFARKHYSKKNITLYLFFIYIAIYFRASLSILKRFFLRTYQPVIDALLIYLGFILISPVWEKNRFGSKQYFPEEYFLYVIPAYVFILLLAIFYSGGYRKPIRIRNLIQGYLSGVIILLLIYALLPETLRFSRVMILLGSALGIPAILLHRIIPHFLKCKDYELSAGRMNKIIIAGNKEEAERVAGIIKLTDSGSEVTGYVSDTPSSGEVISCVGAPDQLQEIVKINNTDEIIFCARDIQLKDIIQYMSLLSGLEIKFKIAPPESISIIGSNSIQSYGELYFISLDSMSTQINKRNKKIFDVISSLFFISTAPVFFLFITDYKSILRNSFKVLSGNYTWVGYSSHSNCGALPVLKKSIYTLSSGLDLKTYSNTSEHLNLIYAKEYSVFIDFGVLWRNVVKK